MQISDRTRKVLWGRSGNRCAICKHELVIDATRDDDESVVADECHIISPQPNGPRHDASYPLDKLDAYENLILLCRTHHKMVDDQTATFTTEILRQFKANHTVWVSQQLAGGQKPQPVRLRRVKQNIPSFLSRLTTGKEVLDLVTNAMAYSFDHDELKSQEEVDLVGAFVEVAQDWGDLSCDLEAGRRVQIAYDITQSLRELEDAGFLVFGGREVQFLEGGDQSAPSSWPVAIMRVLRRGNPAIANINLNEKDKTDAQLTPACDVATRAAHEEWRSAWRMGTSE